VLSVGLIAGMASRLAGARWGLILGVLAAIDPVMLALECHVMSETLATTLLVACAAVVVLGTGRWWGVGWGWRWGRCAWCGRRSSLSCRCCGWHG
jgi:hypothetical protein